MGEAQEAGVEAEAFCGIGFRSIFFITDNRATDGRELTAELMAASSFEREFDKGAVAVFFEKPVVGDGVAGEGGGRADKNLKGIGLVEIGFEGTGFLREMTFDDRFVLLFEGIPVLLQGFFGLRGFSENHQAGGFAIESVNDPDTFFGSIIGELEIGGFFGFGFAGNTKEVGGLLDDKEGGVLEEYFYARRKGSFWDGKAIGANGDGVADGEWVIELGNWATVDGDGLEFEPGTDLLLFLIGPSGEHLFEKRSWLRDNERIRHGASLEQKGGDGNVWRLVEKGERGRVWV